MHYFLFFEAAKKALAPSLMLDYLLHHQFSYTTLILVPFVA